ncbi:MAG: M48 family metalloprotease [Hymenobacter sp.]
MQSIGGVVQQGVGLWMLKYSRGDENEADALGVKYSTKVGYDASHMASFFQTLERTEQQSGSSTPTFLSSHPNSADRYQRVKGLAAQARQTMGKTTLTINRDSYLRSIDGLAYGEDPRQGFVESGVFYHPDLKFRFPIPAGWKSQNSPEQFQMAEPNSRALLAFLGVPGSSLEEGAQALAKQLGVSPGSAQRLTVGGLPALVFEGDQQSFAGPAKHPGPRAELRYPGWQIHVCLRGPGNGGHLRRLRAAIRPHRPKLPAPNGRRQAQPPGRARARAAGQNGYYPLTRP